MCAEFDTSLYDGLETPRRACYFYRWGFGELPQRDCNNLAAKLHAITPDGQDDGLTGNQVDHAAKDL